MAKKKAITDKIFNHSTSKKGKNRTAIEQPYKQYQAEEFKCDTEGMSKRYVDDYRQKPYQHVSDSRYHNMMVCHAISKRDELIFMKQMNELQALQNIDEKDM